MYYIVTKTIGNKAISFLFPPGYLHCSFHFHAAKPLPSSMSMSLKELDYISSSEAEMEKITHKQDLNLKATELRLGLPGSESPERNTINGGGTAALKILVSGAKRVFSDTIKTSSGTWGFSDNGGSEVDFVRNSAFFSSSSSSPRGENKNPSSVKDAVVSSSSKNYLHDKHSQISASNGQDSIAASK